MKISLRLFAGLHDLVGERDISLDLPDGATVEELKSRLAAEYPVVQPFLKTLIFAIDDEYIPESQALRDGARVSLIPPVSGGAEFFCITSQPLDPQALVGLVRKDESGAVALFYGVVRNHSEGRAVERLEYEAHESMALRKLREVGDETKLRYPQTSEIGIWHRTGLLAIGETSLLVAVSSPHRKEAFEACHWAVDRVKEVVPIWKKEHWQGGSAWVEGHPVEAPKAAGPQA